MSKKSLPKKLLSVLLAVLMLTSMFSVGISGIIAEAKVGNHVKVAKERSIFQTPREEDFSFSYCFFFFLSSCAVTLNESHRIICWKIVHRGGL